jgi:signal transduction histidine kinase
VKDDFVYADIFMVSTILRNLLTNAIKFTNKNGKIIVSAKKKKGFLFYFVLLLTLAALGVWGYVGYIFFVPKS